jgi:SRSO17 transposase
MRWAIEETIAEGKDIVGLDQYEVRQYWPWYRHMTLCMLAHAYLEVIRSTAPNKGGLPMISSR